jgi:hypothetical protein
MGRGRGTVTRGAVECSGGGRLGRGDDHHHDVNVDHRHVDRDYGDRQRRDHRERALIHQPPAR